MGKVRQFIGSVKNTPEMVLTEYIRVSSITFISGLISPLILKTQGLEFSLMVIGVIAFIMRLKAIVVILLKNVPMNTRALLYIVSSVVEVISSTIYYVDVHIWIITQVIYTFIAAILLDMYYIEYDVILAKDFSNEIFRDVQYTEKLLMTIAGTLGALLSIALASVPNIIMMLVILFVILIELPSGIAQYKRF